MKIAYLGLGSNIGDREGWLRAALERLDTADLKLRRVSSAWETEPVGLHDQAWFLNVVAEFETGLFPKTLLQRTTRIENELGRKRTVRNGPRNIDIDILLYADSVVKTEELEIPHPRYHERRFTLAPLVELRPDLRDPVTGRSVAALLRGLQGQAARQVAFSYGAGLRRTDLQTHG